MLRSASAAGAVLVAIAATNWFTPPAQAAKSRSVTIGFEAVAGDHTVKCGTPIPRLGTTAQTAQLKDLRFFVSDVKLVTRSGTPVPLNLRTNAFQIAKNGGVTLIDLEDGAGGCAEEGTKATNAKIQGTVPAGQYTGVRWTIGVPFALNHTDATTAPAPLNSAAMAWSWQVGRKFTKIEVSDPAGGSSSMDMGGGMPGMQMGGIGPTPAPAEPGRWSTSVFFVHLGSVGCKGNPATGATVKCSAANRPAMRLAKFDPAKQNIALDLEKLLAKSDVTRNSAGAPGCMSEPNDPECVGIFGALGLRSGSQSAFRAVAK